VSNTEALLWVARQLVERRSVVERWKSKCPS